MAPPISKRAVESFPLHLGRDEAHLVERGRDEAREPDDVGLLALGGLEDLRRGHHDAEIDHLVVVALEHDADDVLADVVHVALDGGHNDLAGGGLRLETRGLLLRLEVGLQVGDCLLHHARRLHDLRQEHLAGTEQVADDVHASHQGTLDDVQRLLRLLARFLGVGLDVVGDAVHERMRQALLDRSLAPGEVLLLSLRAAAVALELRRRFEQPVGRIRAAVEDHILAQLTQLRIDVVVERELPGVDDPHVHAGADGVVEEHRVHRLTHRLVAAEGERQVRDAARDVHQRHLLLDAPRRLDVGEPVAVVLLDARRDREDVGIEDDVLGREADLLCQELVGALADRDLAIGGVGLPLLVEGHDHDGGAVAQDLLGVLQKGPLALLHADRVDDGLALHALEAGLDHAPLGAIDHERHARDVGLGRDEIEERRHRPLRVEQAFVHVDVEDLRAVLHLRARNAQRGGVVVRLDEFAKLRRAGDVRSLADVDEGLCRVARCHSTDFHSELRRSTRSLTRTRAIP